MHHTHYNKTIHRQLNAAPTESTFLHYQAGRLDGFAIGYRQGAADKTETNAASAEHAARVFYAMTAEDADWRHLSCNMSTADEATQARREARGWAQKHCTYSGGPVDFWTGEPLETEAASQ